MAFTAGLFGNFMTHLVNKRVNWTSDTIKISLHTSAYVPNQDTHLYQSSVTNELANGSGYTTGGITLAGKTANYDAASNTLVLDADDISIANSTLTWRVAVIYDASGGTAATNPLIAYFVSDTDISSTNGTTSIIMPTSGIVRLQTT
jgi:hypothetical protein